MIRRVWAPLLAICLALSSALCAADDTDRTGVGFRIRSFALKDQNNKSVSLAKASEGRVTVVAFVGTQCPLMQFYGPRLAELASEYQKRDVFFVAVDSNAQDSRQEIAAFAEECGIRFPILRDVNNAVADHFGAQRTPQVFVLDRDRVVRYRGRIDDQYGIHEGISFKRSKPERRDLAVALDEVLDGKGVTLPITEPVGCLIGRVNELASDAKVTFTKHVAKIFNQRCVECHRPGEIGPFSLNNYEEAAGWGAMIREVVNDNRMPPWQANPQYGHFSNDVRLTDAEKKTISDWVDAGCPEGNRDDLPPPPRFVKGWQITKPDMVLQMAKTPCQIPAEGTVDYKYYTVDPKFKRDMWIKAAEARAGNRAVVHHIIVFVEPPGAHKNPLTFDGFLVATAPGARPLVLPDGMAKFVPAGAKLKFQMHYTPTGRPEEDLSSVGLVFADASEVTTLVRTDAAMNVIFKIPPGADDYPIQSMHTIHKDTLLLSLYPHMHLRGKAFRYTARYPDGKEEILLDVPRYDFNWQNTYELAEPKMLPKGTEIRCAALFNNSETNPSNPNPKQAVTFGEQTSDEMMIGFYDVALPRDLAKGTAAGGKSKKGSRTKAAAASTKRAEKSAQRGNPSRASTAQN